MLDGKLLHREVSWISGGEAGPEGQGRGGNQAVGLRQGRPSLSEMATPLPGPMAFVETQGGFHQSGKESPSLGFLRWTKARTTSSTLMAHVYGTSPPVRKRRSFATVARRPRKMSMRTVVSRNTAAINRRAVKTRAAERVPSVEGHGPMRARYR
jgi:hypothetical protein